MTMRLCPRCQQSTASAWCCGLDLATARRWSMTTARIRMLHILARSRKGLTEEEYRLRLSAIGIDSCRQLDRTQFDAMVAGLTALPDTPLWKARAGRRAVTRIIARSA